MALIKLNNRSLEDNAIHGRRNLIINGAMQVAQRGTSFTGNVYTLDRFKPSAANTGELVATVTQESDSPDEFGKSLKVNITTAETTLASNEHLSLRYRVEGQDLQRLKYGTSDAQQTTLSFWVKSSEVATFTVFMYQADDVRLVSKTYTINTANTWEYKTITFPADTTGVIDNNIGEGLQISFGLGGGSDYTGGSSGSWAAYSAGNEQAGNTSSIPTTLNATWQITGVQLEVGDTATPFEHRSYGEELSLCQRYYYQIAGSGRMVGYAFAWNSSEVNVELQLPQVMRASPTVGFSNNTNDFVFSPYDAYFSTFTAAQFWAADIGMRINLYKSGGGFSNPITQGKSGYVRMMDNTTSKITVDAEL